MAIRAATRATNMYKPKAILPPVLETAAQPLKPIKRSPATSMAFAEFARAEARKQSVPNANIGEARKRAQEGGRRLDSVESRQRMLPRGLVGHAFQAVFRTIKTLRFKSTLKQKHLLIKQLMHTILVNPIGAQKDLIRQI